ncbi:ribonuclease H-like domain, reverse transcriptase, RNA-dependent DNA polymerase [Tanacetum coccineum]
MKEIFEMSDLGLLAYYLGIEVTQSGGDISIKQSAYARKILKEAGMLESNETIITMDPGTKLTKTAEGTMVNSTEYRSLIGCLRYPLHTRPDLSYSVGLLSRFMQEPKEQHMKATNESTSLCERNKGIWNPPNKPFRRKQATVALYSWNQNSSQTTAAATQAFWFKEDYSTDYTFRSKRKITIWLTIISHSINKKSCLSGRSKHIDTKYHSSENALKRDESSRIRSEIIRNPLIDKFMYFNSRVEFAHRMALISDDIYKSAAENYRGYYMNIVKANLLCLNSLQRYEVIAVLVAAGFFGYMFALLQREVGRMISIELMSNMSAMMPSQPLVHRMQFQLAHTLKLPMFLHMRAGVADFYGILEQNKHRQILEVVAGYKGVADINQLSRTQYNNTCRYFEPLQFHFVTLALF